LSLIDQNEAMYMQQRRRHLPTTSAKVDPGEEADDSFRRMTQKPNDEISFDAKLLAKQPSGQQPATAWKLKAAASEAQVGTSASHLEARVLTRIQC